MVVALFQSGLRSAQWTSQEMAEFYRADALLRRQGLTLSLESGRTDEGDPWIAFVEPESGNLIAHFARLEGRVVAMDSGEDAAEGLALRPLIDRMLLQPQQAVHGTSDAEDPWQTLFYPAQPDVSCHTAVIAGEEAVCDGYGRAWSLDDAGSDPGLSGSRLAGRSSGEPGGVLRPESAAAASPIAGQVEISAFSLLERDLSGPTPEGIALGIGEWPSDGDPVAESGPYLLPAEPGNLLCAAEVTLQADGDAHDRLPGGLPPDGLLPDGLLPDGLLEADDWLTFQDRLPHPGESEAFQHQRGKPETDPEHRPQPGPAATLFLDSDLQTLSDWLADPDDHTGLPADAGEEAGPALGKRAAGDVWLPESEAWPTGADSDIFRAETRRRPEDSPSGQSPDAVIVGQSQQGQIHGGAGDDLIFARDAAPTGISPRSGSNLAVVAGSGHDVVVLADAGDLYTFIKEQTAENPELTPFLIQIANAVQTHSESIDSGTVVPGADRSGSATGPETDAASSAALRVVGAVDHDALTAFLAGL